MIDFMIVGLPRSGTAWLANWFTTERSICWHEPLWTRPLAELDAVKGAGLFGIADTMLVMLGTDELNAHPAKKLIVHRELGDVNLSLTKAGLPGAMRDEHKWALDEIGGYHITFHDLWNVEKFKPAAEWLLPVPFDTARYALLRDLQVENMKAVVEAREFLDGGGR